MSSDLFCICINAPNGGNPLSGLRRGLAGVAAVGIVVIVFLKWLLSIHIIYIAEGACLLKVKVKGILVFVCPD